MQHVIWPENSSVNSERNRISILGLFNALLYHSFVKSVLYTFVSNWKQMSLSYYHITLAVWVRLTSSNPPTVTPLQQAEVTAQAYYEDQHTEGFCIFLTGLRTLPSIPSGTAVLSVQIIILILTQKLKHGASWYTEDLATGQKSKRTNTYPETSARIHTHTYI